MSDPFRDGHSAALDRAELLARENEELKDEIERLRETGPTPEAEAKVLAKLEERMNQPPPIEPPHDFIPVAERPITDELITIKTITQANVADEALLRVLPRDRSKEHEDKIRALEGELEEVRQRMKIVLALGAVLLVVCFALLFR